MSSLRFFFCAVCGVFLLSACSFSSTPSTVVSCDQQFWNGIVRACVPTGWKVLSREVLNAKNVPEEAVAAFQRETFNAGQLDTVLVIREPLSQDFTTKEYSHENIVAVSALPDYSPLDSITVTVDGEESTIHVFSARVRPDKPVRRYYQLSATHERTGYTCTIAYPLGVQDRDVQEALAILKSLSFVPPAVSKK